MYLKEPDETKRGSGYWSYNLWGGVSAVAWVDDKMRKYRKGGE
jgi:hypothetical protein